MAQRTRGAARDGVSSATRAFNHYGNGAQEQEALKNCLIVSVGDYSVRLKSAKAVAAKLVAYRKLKLTVFQVKHNKW